MSRQGASVPINLSLSEDERSPNRSSADIQSPQLGKAYAAINQNAASSPPEEADPLYEYFPLSVDDWYVMGRCLLRVYANRLQDAPCRRRV